MKILLTAIALTIAAPAFAQGAAPAPHSHDAPAKQAPTTAPSADKAHDAHKMDCCEKMKADGKMMDCCEKMGCHKDKTGAKAGDAHSEHMNHK